jgi:pSer/pThr/pTyr-binding forkhead associated (FHA) protein
MKEHPMSAKVKLTVTQGNLRGKEFLFSDPKSCTVGRAPDCSLKLPDDQLTVSRHHCVFVIAPPGIGVRDAGSLNGTFVNGENIGHRASHPCQEPTSGTKRLIHPLHPGDEVRLGDTVFQVEVLLFPPCTPCGA